MADRGNRFWLWGYVLDTIPGTAAFVDGQTHCSLETAADYLGCDNVLWMNSLHTMDQPQPDQYRHLAGFRQVVCGLTHLETNGPGHGGWELRYVESARQISEFSLTHPNVAGAMLDDFRAAGGPSSGMTPEALGQVYRALKEHNPALKLYVVMYHIRQKAEELLPFQDCFDGASIWCWNSTDHFWNALYEHEIQDFRKLFPDKELIQGQFLHAYGDGDVAQPMDQLELQCRKIAAQMDKGDIDGWCVIQNGFFCRASHRKQAEALRDYWNWYRNTRTRR